MGSGERKLTLYTNGEKVREVEIQHEKKKRSLEDRLYEIDCKIFGSRENFYSLLNEEKPSS